MGEPIPTIEQVIAAIPDWGGRTVTADPVPAGLTNTNYRVDVDGAPHFVRLPGTATDLLAVDRANELQNTRAAALAGVAPLVQYALPQWNVFVAEWLHARTMSNATFQEPGMPGRIAGTLTRLHAGPRFRDDFNMFRLTERYLAVVDQMAIAIPAGYRAKMDQIPRIEDALAAHPLPTVPCHNDLLAENYMDDGERLWIVDYEYSGNNDPTFELGNTCQELGLNADQILELCAAYFGEADPGVLARLRLQMIMSDVGWTLWAAIQARISTIEYDYMSWADARWSRAATRLESPEFDDWLREVRG